MKSPARAGVSGEIKALKIYGFETSQRGLLPAHVLPISNISACRALKLKREAVA